MRWVMNSERSLSTWAIAIVGLLAAGPVSAQTATNTCGYNAGNEYTVNTTCTFQTFNKPAAFTSAMNPGGCNSSAADDAFGWFTATSTTTILTYDPNNNHRPIMHVFTGACGALTQVGCVDAGADGANAELILQTVVGTNYMVRVQRQGTNAEMLGRLCVWSPTTTNWCGYPSISQIPVGNGVCNAQPFVKPAAYTATFNPGGCGSGNVDDAYGWFTATATTTVVSYQPPGGMDAILHVFTGACGSLTQVGCANDGGNGILETLRLTTVVGQNYLIRVQRNGSSAEMNGTICVHTPVTGDECAAPILLPVIPTCIMQTFSNAGATRSTTTPNPSCGGTVSNVNTRDIWFQFTAPLSGRVLIDTEAGTMTNGVMQLYTGTCAALTAVQCDNTSGPGNMPRIDRRCNPLTPLATYYIRFFGNTGQQGTFNICVQGWDVWETPQEDCAGGATVCGDQTINNTTNYSGCNADLNAGNRGCLAGNERQGTWYYFSPSASGTVAMDIIPDFNDDYDFAIWGPMTTISCPPAGPPARCSWAYPPNVPGYPGAIAYRTGMRTSSVDLTEGAGGDGYVAALNVIAGEYYVLYVDNFSSTGQAFSLDWSLSNGASLDCTVLPVELFGFEVAPAGDRVELRWSTASERNSSHWEVERATPGSDFEPIATLPAMGHSQSIVHYRTEDDDPATGINYYRLKQVDTDGGYTYSETLTATMGRPGMDLAVWPNPAEHTLRAALHSARPGSLDWQLVDMSGRVQRTGQRTVEAGTVQLDLFVGDLDGGTYLLVVSPPDAATRLQRHVVKR